MLETDVVSGHRGAGPPPGPGPHSATPGPADRRWTPHGTSVLVLLLVLALTATLALTARTVHENNEEHLLRQRVAEAGAVIGADLPTIQTPLTAAVLVASATGADRHELLALLTPLVSSGRFVSTSVWPATAPDPRPLLTVGVRPELLGLPAAERQRFLAGASSRTGLTVLDLLQEPERHLGYAVGTGVPRSYVVYAESAIPQNRRARVDSNSAFADLNYAIYLGTVRDQTHLIAASVADPNFTGPTASDSVPFGQSNIQLVMSPRRELGGMLLARLAWLIAVVGVVVALAATLMTERLVRRRLYAETLARDNARLFSEQRSVARMLQHSLLPEQLPEFTGLDIAVRYVAGVHGVEIGGDWYDVIEIDETHIMFVVGDVSGRGLRAATVMASLRYAIRAYAVQGDDPASILLKLTNLISVGRDGHFATVLCALVDIVGREMTVANAGHPLPLLIADHEAQYLHTEVGPPVGVSHGPYVASHATVPRGATVLAFTDGLFERRGENPDVGLSRLRAAAIGYQSLDALLDGLLNTMTPSGTHDDTAILGIRWRT